MNDTLYRKIFLLGGLWNIGMGVFGLVFYDFATRLLLGVQALNGNFYQVLFFKIFMLAVIIFGIGYCSIAKDLTRNRVVIWLGMAAKLLLFGIFTWCFIIGQATFLAFLTLSGDFLWAIVFFRFLQLTRKNVTVNNFIG